MKRLGVLLFALSLVCSALAAAEPQAGKAPKPLPYVVVDPNDLRQPVPDPEQGLTERYDGKLVRFTGAARRWSLDKNTKRPTFELHHDIVKVVAAKGKKVAVREETVVVPVTLQTDDRQLRAKKAGFLLTVEGKGVVMTDGTLLITDAVVIPTLPALPGGRPEPKK